MKLIIISDLQANYELDLSTDHIRVHELEFLI